VQEEYRISVNPEDQEIDFSDLPSPKEQRAVHREPIEKRPISRRAANKAFSRAWSLSHKGLAYGLGDKRLELSKEEADILGASTIDLMKAYGWDLSAHPKLSATIDFSLTLADIDSERFMIILTRGPKRRENEAPEQDLPPIILPTS
jgi:hypothetical protein